ncbi:MAG TPA: energy-coupling factor transporter transmembrane component T [Candidatus Limnocylindria bacterium]|nr:energy-coupling factor transporter transmembrane component T [Candidatus Limnocylindria bacterium]
MPAFLGKPGPTPYHRLNPLTKLVAATSVALAAIILGDVAGPIALLAAGVVLPAVVARSLRALARAALLLTLPLALSILLVNLFFFPGGERVLLRIGPVAATLEGLAFGIEILLRLLAISGAITLFYLTTPVSELVIDLERRGVPARLAHVASASVQTVPAMVERAAAITAAQRARGLDTEGSPWRRLRGLLPLAGPVILGSIAEVEERAMALEARGFTRPGPRTLLWHPADSGWQRAARWSLLAGVVGLAAGRLGGWPG